MKNSCFAFLYSHDKPVLPFKKVDNQKRELVHKEDSSKEAKSDNTGSEIECG